MMAKVTAGTENGTEFWDEKERKQLHTFSNKISFDFVNDKFGFKTSQNYLKSLN